MSQAVPNPVPDKQVFNYETIYKRARTWAYGESIMVIDMKSEKTRSLERKEGKSLESKGIVKEENAQFGYGEITAVSIKTMLAFIGCLENTQAIDHNIPDLDLYEITDESIFLDIGYGLGKAVMHVALAIGCRSHGIEVL